MKASLVEVEFYFRSSNRRHVEALERIKSTLRLIDGFTSLREVDCDHEPARAETLPALPCLRRLEPRPERFLVGPFQTTDDVALLLGVPLQGRKENSPRSG